MAVRDVVDERDAPGPVGRSLLALAIGDPALPDPRGIREAEMNQRHIHRRTGRGFRSSIEAFERSRDPRSSGQIDRAGNGAAMRIAPTAVALRDLSDDEFVGRLVDVSLITHREVRALAGMLSVAFVARAVAGRSSYPLDRGEGRVILTDLVPWLRSQEDGLIEEHGENLGGHHRVHEFSEALAGVLDRWDLGWDACADWIQTNATEKMRRRAWVGTGFVTASVCTAVSWTLRSDMALPETLVRTVGFGGDTDTVAAMVGGMAGPGSRLDSVPVAWLRFEGRRELEAVGRAVDTAVPAGLPDVLELEIRLTALVHGSRLRARDDER